MKQKTSQYAWMRTDKIAILNSRLGETLHRKMFKERSYLVCFFFVATNFFPETAH